MFTRPARVALAIGLFLALGGNAPARGAAADLGFVPIEAGHDGDVSKAKIDSMLRRIGAQVPSPRHIVVLVQGFEVPAQPVTELYMVIAKRTRAAFATVGESVQIVGVKWPAGQGANYDSIQRTFSYTAAGPGRDPKYYFAKVALAAKVGRLTLRKVFLSLKDRFPDARLHTFAHSLGGEALTSALQVPPRGQPYYRRGDKIAIDLGCFAGADANQDQTVAPRYRGGGCHLYWITQGRPGEKRDQAHKLGRFLVPQKAAAPGMLKFRTDQLDNLISRAGIVFDTDDLPADQAFLSYFTPDRLERLAGAASTMRNPSKPKSGLLQRLAEVLKAPAKVAALAPYLKDPELSVAMYALWRLDRQLCGSCVHLADGTIRKAASTFMGKPVMSEQQRRNCPCRLVREGIWPPEGLLPADPDKLEE